MIGMFIKPMAQKLRSYIKEKGGEIRLNPSFINTWIKSQGEKFELSIDQHTLEIVIIDKEQ